MKKGGWPKNQKTESSDVSVCSLSVTPPVTPQATSAPVKEMPVHSMPHVITSPMASESQCTLIQTTTAMKSVYTHTDNHSHSDFIRNTNVHQLTLQHRRSNSFHSHAQHSGL